VQLQLIGVSTYIKEVVTSIDIYRCLYIAINLNWFIYRDKNIIKIINTLKAETCIGVTIHHPL